MPTLGQKGEERWKKYVHQQDKKSFGQGGTGAGLTPEERRRREEAFSARKRRQMKGGADKRGMDFMRKLNEESTKQSWDQVKKNTRY